MILSFKTHFPWGEPTWFTDKIYAGVYPDRTKHKAKIHTVREGHRIQPGTWLHMATGVRSKKYNQFNRGVHDLARCKGTQRFDLSFRANDVVALYIDKKLKYCKNREHVWEVEPGWMLKFVQNDGFDDVEQFFKWFNKPCRNYNLIHWTGLKY